MTPTYLYRPLHPGPAQFYCNDNISPKKEDVNIGQNDDIELSIDVFNLVKDFDTTKEQNNIASADDSLPKKA